MHCCESQCTVVALADCCCLSGVGTITAVGHADGTTGEEGFEFPIVGEQHGDATTVAP